MNNSTNSTPEMSGRRYWRSLEELADTPEFKEWLHQEFPKGASEWVDDVSRRHFLRIMSASFALAGLGLAGAGCRRPIQKLEPFGKQPENYVFGTLQYYATAMPTRIGAVPLVVRAYDNRPIKIEGNSMFPGSNGGTDRYAQASILNLYDPDRARRFLNDGKEVSREAALKFLGDLSSQFAGNNGEGLAFLAESSTSPSRTRLQKIIARKFPKSQWFTYDAIDSGIHQRAASAAFGRDSGGPVGTVRPVFHFDKAKVILSLDCDFLGGEDDAHNHIHKFSTGRKAGEEMSRLYCIESLFTLTGANADHRLRIPASQVAEIAQSIYKFAFGNGTATPGSFQEKWAYACGQDLLAHKGEVLVVAGQRQPVEVHLLAHLLNDKLGALGKTVTLAAVEEDRGADLTDFNATSIKTLVVVGGNPVYNASSDFLHPILAKSGPKPAIVRLGYYEDETSAVADWNFPATHYLESWGDARTSDGTLVPIQPLIQPLFGGITELEFLARIAGESQVNAYELTRATFGGSDEEWKRFLFNGFQAGEGRHEAQFGASSDALKDALNKAAAAQTLSASNLELIFYRDAKMDDGFYANNGWMQELPDPITKITWDNAVLVSHKTAQELGLRNGDIIEITLNGGAVLGPIWVQPGMADYSLGLALGYGRDIAGRVGDNVGFNAYKIFNGKYIETGATIRKTGGTWSIATTQSHWSMEGRPAVREANLSEFLKAIDKPEPENLAEEFKDKEPPVVAPLYPNPFDETKKRSPHQWGMVVDLGACVGCGTCVLACQSENNIPIVGKDQVLRGRDMQWMRIDRYYTTDPKRKHNPSLLDPNADENLADDKQQVEDWIEDVQAVTQPMFCQMCEAAPCENVCPVNATSHDDSGLNVMTYNRCIGTRYCSNNCPYKVRRFNYLDFNKRPLEALKGPMYRTPLMPNSRTDGEWDLARWWKDRSAPMRPEDEWDLIKLSKNPDVTVRMRGVMEKCTFCVQRIKGAEIAQKVMAGASDDIRLKESEGTIPKTACQQACPAGALVFGDITDPESSVSLWKKQPRNYVVLEQLLTKPRTSYLARIRNPNPAMPDYHAPYSTEEYEAAGGQFQAPEKS